MNNTKLTKYLFGLGSFIIVFYLAINTNEVNTQAVIQKENIITEKQKLNQIDEGDFSVTKEKLKDLTDLPSVEDESFETIDNNTDYIDLAEDQKSIFVNNIKIAKQIDSDESSDTYREPISSYKTITTLDKTNSVPSTSGVNSNVTSVPVPSSKTSPKIENPITF